MTVATVAEVLASCLARVEAGESVATVLADHPGYSDELRALIGAATAVRAHRPSPSPAFRAALQHRLAEGALPSRGGRLTTGRGGWRVWLLRAATAAAAAVTAFSGLAVASADSRPGDLLYPVRRGVERVHDAAERVMPPIGRAIDYLTIRTVSDRTASDAADPDATAAPSPTAPLAPGSSVLEDRPRVARPRTSSNGAADGLADTTPEPTPDADAAIARARRRPNPAPIPVEPDPAATGPLGASAVAATTRADVAGTQAAADAAGTARAARDAAGDAGSAAASAVASAASPTPKRSQTPVRPTASPPPATAVRAPDAAVGGGMSGQVTGRERVGLPGALVSVYPISDDGTPRWSKRVSARTRDDGTFLFTQLPPGRYKLAVGELSPMVWRVWYRDTLQPEAAEPIVIESGRTTPGIEVRLRYSPWLMGRREPIGRRPPRH